MIKLLWKNRSGGFAFVLFLSSIIFNIQYQSCNLGRPLKWDETDYASAAQSGVITNAFEKHSMSFIQLAELGMARLKNLEIDLKTFPIESQDPFQLRHFHPPLPVYCWHFFLNSDLDVQQAYLRLSNILLSVIISLALLFFIIKTTVSSNKKILFFTGFLLIPLFITSGLFLKSFFELNFHIYFFLVTIWFIHCLMSYISITSRRNAVMLGLSAALIVCTLETSLFIFAGTLLSVFLLKKQSVFKSNKKIIFAVLIVSSIIIWPGILNTLGPVKSWAMYVYRVFAVHNASYEDVSVLSNLLDILRGDYLFFLLMITGYVQIFISFFSERPMDRLVLIPGIIGLFYAIVMLPFTLNHTYIFPSVGLLFIGSVPGIVKLVESSEKVKHMFLALCIIYITSLYMITDFGLMRSNAQKQADYFNSDLLEVKKLLSAKQPLLIDGGRIFRYNLPEEEENIIELFRINTKTSEFAIRKNYNYVLQDSMIENRFYKAIVIEQRRNYTTEQFEKLKHWGYTMKELNNYYLFSINNN